MVAAEVALGGGALIAFSFAPLLATPCSAKMSR